MTSGPLHRPPERFARVRGNPYKFHPHGNVGSALVISAIVLLASIGMRAIAHPFFHMGLGLLLAHTIGFSPGYTNDYILVFVVPVMYGIAFCNEEP